MQELLQLARDAIESELTNKELNIPVHIKSSYTETSGVFIVLKKQGVERGTFGFPETLLPLWKSVPSAAKAAAFNDPQFPPITEIELKDVDIEIYLLAKPIAFVGLDFDINDTIMAISCQGEAVLLPGLAKTKEEALILLHKKLNDLNSKYYKFGTKKIN